MSAGSQLDVFRGFTSENNRLNIYTCESSAEIPESPGCYAWMLPLWIVRENLDKFLGLVSNLFNYEPEPKKLVDVSFAWEDINLKVSRSLKPRATEAKESTWHRVRRGVESEEALQQILLESSLLMPPLYVGMTNDLRRRYVEHTQHDIPDRNNFRRRFIEHTSSIGLKIAVHDLLFVCIETPKDIFDTVKDNVEVSEREFNELVEQILIQLCRPLLSER